ncbi:hypothetical protein MMC14_005629, partial [Varicellaria rhodocarpa]|nr:hypothetical protein [Varicellaria rhodocarpa]
RLQKTPLKDRALIPACTVRGCAQKLQAGNVKDLFSEGKHVAITIIPPPTPPGGSPRSGSPSPERKSPRSPFDFAERGLDSITAREVQEALARGIQRRDVMEQREA